MTDNILTKRASKPASKPSTPTTHWSQKRTFTIAIALFGLIIVLIVMTLSVVKYETHLSTGDTVLLELTPIDPRGFMQGDYMTLRYDLERDILERLATASDRDKPSDGYVIVALDEHNVGHFVRLADSHQPATLAYNEKAIHYRRRHGSIQIATNAYFFQEGSAEAFEAAEYGVFRLNDNGEPLLASLANEAFEVIEPKERSQTPLDNPPD